MNRVALATVHETQSRRWTTFTPPYTAAHTALHGLFLLRRSHPSLHRARVLWGSASMIRTEAPCEASVVPITMQVVDFPLPPFGFAATTTGIVLPMSIRNVLRIRLRNPLRNAGRTRVRNSLCSCNALRGAIQAERWEATTMRVLAPSRPLEDNFIRYVLRDVMHYTMHYVMIGASIAFVMALLKPAVRPR